MINSSLMDRIKLLGISDREFEKIIEKSVAGGELAGEDDIDDWLARRFLPNTVLINKNQYAEMCVNALKIVATVAATDYGSSRQRDMGQLWADMIRGYLGEIAFKQFLELNWNVASSLGHDKGSIDGYLPMDIHQVKFPGEEYRRPNLSISIKSTKWNGIWLDIPGNQFRHSDIHVLVKVGVGRDHLFAFFKEISVFKDKVLKTGEQTGAISKDESSRIFESLPSFRQIPAYICGFIFRDTEFKELPYSGKKGRKHYKVKSWKGAIRPGDKDKIKETEGVPGKVTFEGIGDFSHDSGYLFNTGSMLWKKEDWSKVISRL